MDSNRTINLILLITVFTLAMIVVAVTGVLISGLFDTRVDNAAIFDVIGPAFNTVIGAFVGLIGGISLARDKNES